ncbi:MAG: FAD:protein FMN transferase [Holophagaceae bacterium]|nr:FAD:protein FMN transferase [Holophagaceae bacterium]
MLRLRTITPVTLALLLSGLTPAQEPGFHREVLAMGTRLSLRIEGGAQEQLASASEAAFIECNRIEAACSTWKPDSVFSRLNQADGRAVLLDREWLDLLDRARGQSHRTGGAFDPLLFRLLSAYGIREGGRKPSRSELAEARAASGARHLRLSYRRGAARLRQGAGIDEGGFAKGYALDRMRARLAHSGIRSGFLDFGGQLMAFGPTVEVSIADPKDRTRPRFSIALKDASLASSGLSEHGSHIVDPRNGRPCADWGSVSVIAPSAFEADCLSTALYVMGPARGLAWAKRHAIAAIFLLNSGRTRMSPAFAAMHPNPIPMEKP